MKMFLCEKKGFGFMAKTQNYGSIYLTFTQDKNMARPYKTKQGAARALNYKKWDSDKAKEDLVFYEVDL